MRWSEAGCLSQIMLTHALRQAPASLILSVRQKSMKPFDYSRLHETDSERLAEDFCRQHGDSPNGLISDTEYDRLFDHVAAVLKKYGSFSEGGEVSDFCGSRYVDQIPWIIIVPNDGVKPSIAVSAALEIVSTAHRPLTIGFDYYPNELLIMPPAKVFSTFSESELDEN